MKEAEICFSGQDNMGNCNSASCTFALHSLHSSNRTKSLERHTNFLEHSVWHLARKEKQVSNPRELEMMYGCSLSHYVTYW